MRWPFPRRRTADPTASGSDRPSVSLLPERTGTFVPPRRDWAALPPIGTAVAAMPLTADSRFETALAARAGHLTLEPLTHMTGPEAPGGVVSARAALPLEDTGPMPGTGPLWPATDGPLHDAEPAPAAQPSDAPPPRIQRRSESPVPRAVPGAPGIAVPPRPAGPGAASAMAATEADGPGVLEVAAAPPPRRVQVFDAPCPVPPPLTRVVETPPSADPERTSPAPQPLQRSVEADGASGGDGAAAPPPPPPVPVPRRSLGASRRLGLGPPLLSRPSVVASRTALEPDTASSGPAPLPPATGGAPEDLPEPPRTIPAATPAPLRDLADAPAESDAPVVPSVTGPPPDVPEPPATPPAAPAPPRDIAVAEPDPGPGRPASADPSPQTPATGSGGPPPPAAEPSAGRAPAGTGRAAEPPPPALPLRPPAVAQRRVSPGVHAAPPDDRPSLTAETLPPAAPLPASITGAVGEQLEEAPRAGVPGPAAPREAAGAVPGGAGPSRPGIPPAATTPPAASSPAGEDAVAVTTPLAGGGPPGMSPRRPVLPAAVQRAASSPAGVHRQPGLRAQPVTADAQPASVDVQPATTRPRPPGLPAQPAAVQRATPPPGAAPRSREIPLAAERMLRPTSGPAPVESPPPVARATMEAALGGDLGGVRVHRDEAAAHTAGRMGAEAVTVGDDIHLPSHHGSLESGPAASLLAHELTHVAQQRRLGSALPPEGSDHGRALEAQAQAVQRSWESGSLPLAVRHGAPPPHRDQGDRSGEGTADLVESMVSSGYATASADGSLHFTPPGSGEGAGVAAGLTAQRATETSPSAAPVPSAPAGGAATPGGDDAQLEELAQRIYHHIRWRLRSELLLDRERAGLMTDLS